MLKDVLGLLILEFVCDLSMIEWPDEPRLSKVHCDRLEWIKLVKAAHQRGMMTWLDESKVFSPRGKPLLNGAMGVRKVKKLDGVEVECQRFISILTPINEYVSFVVDGDQLLPYVGQLTTLVLDGEQIAVVDSDDLESCFNLFRMPPDWYPYFGFSMKVPLSTFGVEDDGDRMVVPALMVVPMGFKASVGIVQAAVRRLVFEECKVEKAAELNRVQTIPDPQEGLADVYLDSFDWIRLLPRCVDRLRIEESVEHKRFTDKCAELQLPLNVAKRLVGAVSANIQG
eukprot:6455066-Amphidinium_carterae.1